MSTAPDPFDSSQDDVDARFAELIEGTFGERIRTKAPKRPTQTVDDDNPSSLLRAWDAADQIDDETWRTPPLEPMGRWSGLASLGTVLGLLGVVLALLRWFGIPMATWVSWLAVASAVTGLALLVTAALRRRGRPRDDDGAVV